LKKVKSIRAGRCDVDINHGPWTSVSPAVFAQLPMIGRGAFVTGVLESMKLRGWDGTVVFSLDGHVRFRN
jgi:hypothetical protein